MDWDKETGGHSPSSHIRLTAQTWLPANRTSWSYDSRSSRIGFEPSTDSTDLQAQRSERNIGCLGPVIGRFQAVMCNLNPRNKRGQGPIGPRRPLHGEDGS